MGRHDKLAKARIATAVRSDQYRRIPADTECTLSLAQVIEFRQYWVKGRVRESAPRPGQQPLPLISLGSLHGPNTMGSAPQNSAATRQNPEETRNRILASSLREVTFKPGTRNCKVTGGVLDPDPYTGQRIPLQNKAIEVDHVVPLARAFALGAWQWDPQQRQIFANDPIELIPVSKAANRQKSDSGLDEWLPTFQPCTYIQRYLTVAAKYQLPITAAEHTVATTTCPAAATAPAA